MGVDAEADGDKTGNLHDALFIDGLRLLNNTFVGYNFGAIAVPVGGDSDTVVGNIDIRGKKLLTGPSQAVPVLHPHWCTGSTLIESRNVVVEDNEAVAMTMAI